MSAEVAPCGTYAAYCRHYKRGEPVDDPCREARNEYVAELRRTNHNTVQRARRTRRMRERALSRLQDAHPEEFRRLLAEEYEKEPVR